MTTRLKVLANLDLAERRKPQEGRLTLSASAVGRMLDIRVTTLPTVDGEKVVMRLLDKSRKTKATQAQKEKRRGLPRLFVVRARGRTTRRWRWA